MPECKNEKRLSELNEQPLLFIKYYKLQIYFYPLISGVLGISNN